MTTVDTSCQLVMTSDMMEFKSIHNSGLDFALVVGSSSAIMQTTQTCCTWVHVVLVGKLPHSVGVAYSGHLDDTTALSNGDTYAPSTSRMIVFGNQWINDEGTEFGTAWIDHVVIFNRMLPTYYV